MSFSKTMSGLVFALHVIGTCGVAWAGFAYDDPLLSSSNLADYEIATELSHIPFRTESSEEMYETLENQEQALQDAKIRAEDRLRKSFMDGLKDADGKASPKILRNMMRAVKKKQFLKAFALGDAILLNPSIMQELDDYWAERLLIVTRDSFKEITKQDDAHALYANVFRFQSEHIPDVAQNAIFESAVLEDMAQRCANTGKYQAAYELRKACLQKLEQQPQSASYIQALNQLAATCILMGQYEQAREIAKTVPALANGTEQEEMLLKDRARNLETEAALGLGNMKEAQQLAGEAMRSCSWRLWYKEKNPNAEAHKNALESALAKAKIYLRDGQWKKAYDACKWIEARENEWDALASGQNANFGEKTLPQIFTKAEELQSARMDLQEIEADIYRDKGRHDRALGLYREIVFSRQSIGGWSANPLSSYWDHSDSNMHRVETLRSLLSLVRECRIAELYTEADALAQEGYMRAKEREGFPAALIDAYRKEIRRIQQAKEALPPVSLSALEKQWKFFSDYPMDVRRAAYIRRLPSYKSIIEQFVENGHGENAFKMVELCKSRFLLEIFSRQIANELLSEEDQTRLDTRQREMFREESTFRQIDYAQLSDASHADIYFEAMPMEAQRDRNVYAYKEFCRQLAKKYPQWERESRYRPLSIEEAMDFLPEKTAYVSFLQLSPKRVLVIVLDKVKGFYAGYVELPWDLSEKCGDYHDLISCSDLFEMAKGEKFLWRYPDQTYRVTASHEPEGAASRVKDLDEFKKCRWDMAAEIGRVLLNPLSRHISSDTSAWIISPDSSLASIPFETLVYQGKPLIASFDVSYGQSLSALSLLEKRRDMRTSRQEKNLFIIGNPTYDDLSAKDNAQLAKMGAFDQERLPKEYRSYNWLFLKMWNNLKYADEEIRAARDCFSDFSDDDLLSQKNATREKFMERDSTGELARYKYLLFVAHGIFMPSVPEHSALILRRDNALTAQGSGLLTVLDLMSLHLNSDLVYLSACETGLGAYTTGEGVFGLPLALNVAGNRNTVMSLWNIDDEAAAFFSERFFRRLAEGLPPTKALSSIKREWLQKPNGEFADPFFWSPMILYGID